MLSVNTLQLDINPTYEEYLIRLQDRYPLCIHKFVECDEFQKVQGINETIDWLVERCEEYYILACEHPQYNDAVMMLLNKENTPNAWYLSLNTRCFIQAVKFNNRSLIEALIKNRFMKSRDQIIGICLANTPKFIDFSVPDILEWLWEKDFFGFFFRQ